jgi:hypothetical protein
MKRIYGHVADGYIQSTEVPTCWHHRFESEICLFECKNNLVPIPQGGRKKKTGGQKRKSKPQVGGGWEITQSDEDRFDERMRDMGIDIDAYVNRLRGKTP